MNICMFSPFSFSMESSTHRLVSFAKELVNRGNEVSIILPRFDRHSKNKAQRIYNFHGIQIIQPYQLPVEKIGISSFPYIASSFIKAIPLNIDIIHVLKPLPNNFIPYTIKYLKQKPLLLDMDDLDHTVMVVENHNRLNIKFVEYCEIIFPSLSNHITTCSSSLRQMYLNMGFKEEKISWLPNGVKTSDFNKNFPQTLKQNISLKDNVIVYLGSINNDIQIYPLIKAMELIVTKRKDVSCLIIGDGRSKLFFEKMVKNLKLSDYIKFIGRIPYSSVNEYLSICDIGFACCPPPLSTTGGALKVFNYMASGLPVVVDETGDLPYYIDFGNAGKISKLDPKNLSATFLELIEDDKSRKQKGKYARKYVENNFDWKILTSKLIEIYKNL